MVSKENSVLLREILRRSVLTVLAEGGLWRLNQPHIILVLTMIDEATIAKAVDLLRQAAPGARIILFGSYARGEADEGSDLDFLVVEPEVANEFEETIRLSNVLRPLRLPVDVIVTSRHNFDYWAETPGSVYHEAAMEGRLFETVP